VQQKKGLAHRVSDHNRFMLRYFINFVYPPRCVACGTRMSIDTTGKICDPCIELIDRLPEPICQVCGVPLQLISRGSLLNTGERTTGEALASQAIESEACPPDNAEGAARSEWCRACVQSRPHFGLARAIARYRPGIAEDSQVVPSVIRRLKYGRDQSLSYALGQCLGDTIPLNSSDYDLVIPVPLHRRRLRWRGFNQAALLGRIVARKMDLRLDVAALVRTRDTPPQTRQDSAQRRHNVRGAFAVARPQRIANRRLLLVDDVMTTGATLDECARTLLAAGARNVDVFTLARAI
jgi:ComF family protein